MDAIKLTPEQVVEISVIDHKNPYKNGQRAKDKKTFSRYRYNGVVFTVDTDNPFNDAFTAGQVRSVKLLPGQRDVISVDDAGAEIKSSVPTLAFDNFISRTQYNALQQDRVVDAGIEYKIARYQHLATTPITAELLSELEAAM